MYLTGALIMVWNMWKTVRGLPERSGNRSELVPAE